MPTINEKKKRERENQIKQLESRADYNIRGSIQDYSHDQGPGNKGNSSPPKCGLGYERPWRKLMSKNPIPKLKSEVQRSTNSVIPIANGGRLSKADRGLLARDNSEVNIRTSSQLDDFGTLATKRSENKIIVQNQLRPVYKDYLSEIRSKRTELKNTNNDKIVD